VEVESVVAEEPLVYGRCLVGGEVVQDHVDVEAVGDVAVDLVQKRDEVGACVGGASTPSPFQRPT
jgi:hypothetical protein